MTELTDKMRTCAAHIMARPHDAPMPTEHLLDDAAALLNDAADLLEAPPAPLGEPMAVIEPPPPDLAIDRTPSPVWPTPGASPPVVGPAQWTAAAEQLRLAGELARKSNACPVCDSRAGKRVRVFGKDIWLMCACGASWKKQA